MTTHLEEKRKVQNIQTGKQCNK